MITGLTFCVLILLFVLILFYQKIQALTHEIRIKDSLARLRIEEIAKLKKPIIIGVNDTLQLLERQVLLLKRILDEGSS